MPVHTLFATWIETSNIAGDAKTKKEIRKAKSVTMMLDTLQSKKPLIHILEAISMPVWIQTTIISSIFILLALLGFAIYTIVLARDSIDFVHLSQLNSMEVNPVGEGQLLVYHDFREMLLISSYIDCHYGS